MEEMLVVGVRMAMDLAVMTVMEVLRLVMTREKMGVAPMTLEGS